MIALYTDSDRGEMKLSGDKSEWEEFSVLLLTHMAELSCDPVDDPSPYAAMAAKIRVVHDNSEKVTIGVNASGVICIHGSAESCADMSEAIRSFAHEFRPGEHFHADPIDSHYISAMSAFVVLNML